MSVSGKVLVDTSAWIDYFRGIEPCHSLVMALVNTQRICCVGVVLAELIQGAKSDKEVNVLRDFVHLFDFPEEGPWHWERAGVLSNKLRRQGRTVPLSDCYLAISAHANNVDILSKDNHLHEIAHEVGVRVYGLT